MRAVPAMDLSYMNHLPLWSICKAFVNRLAAHSVPPSSLATKAYPFSSKANSAALGKGIISPVTLWRNRISPSASTASTNGACGTSSHMEASLPDSMLGASCPPGLERNRQSNEATKPGDGSRPDDSSAHPSGSKPLCRRKLGPFCIPPPCSPAGNAPHDCSTGCRACLSPGIQRQSGPQARPARMLSQAKCGPSHSSREGLVTRAGHGTNIAWNISPDPPCAQESN